VYKGVPMKIILLSFIFSTMAFSNTYKYRLFEDTINRYTPYTVSIVTVGEFKKGAEVMRIYLDKEIPISYPIMFFDWKGKSLKDNFKFKWNSDDTLTIYSKRRSSFKSLLTTADMNSWGDTSINPTDEYSVYFPEGITLNKDQTINGVQFRIENETVEESALWGILKN